jgi:hypothetical protein
MRTRTAILLGIIVGVVTACGSPAKGDPNAITIDPHWSIEVAAGVGDGSDVLLGASAMYWPDYSEDGGVGVLIYGGDPIPNHELLLGPVVEFHTGDIYQEALSRLLPNAWADAVGDVLVSVRPYGRASVVFDYGGNPTLVAGTATRIWPNKKIQPVIRTDFFHPSGNSRAGNVAGWVFSLGVTAYF